MKSEKLIIYQLFPRLFSNTTVKTVTSGSIEENGTGKFNDINDAALAAIKALGCNCIWYTGIIRHATITDHSEHKIYADHPQIVKGRAGSPYAVKDFYDVAPALAEDISKRMVEMQALVARTHRHGLKAIIDLVPNHVARQYASQTKPQGVKDFGADDDNTVEFSPHNNFYYLPGRPFQVPQNVKSLIPFEEPYQEFPAKATGNDIFSEKPNIHDWYETVKLNYGVDYSTGRKYFDPIPDTWHKMLHIIFFWLEKGIDGFRCDMVEMVPIEFWSWVISSVKEKFPEAIFIAEIYNPAKYRDYISNAGFTYLYDKSVLYDHLHAVLKDDGDIFTIKTSLEAQQDIDPSLLRFMENHDELRIASPHFTGDAFRGIPAMVLSATAGKGPVMIYNGQESGEAAAGATGFSGDDGRTSIFDYCTMPQHQKWVNELQYDGGKLSEEQRFLREIYQRVLNFCRSAPSIVSGEYIDLMTSEAVMKKVYIFGRKEIGKMSIIACSFNENMAELRIGLPEALRSSAIEADILNMNDTPEIIPELQHISLSLKPFTATILTLSPPPPH